MTDYDTLARAYSKADGNNLLNAWYEPAMVELAREPRAVASWTRAVGPVR